MCNRKKKKEENIYPKEIQLKNVLLALYYKIAVFSQRNKNINIIVYISLID